MDKTKDSMLSKIQGLIPLAALIISLLGSAAVIPFTLFVTADNALLKQCWRSQESLPFTLIAVYCEKRQNQYTFKGTFHQYKLILFTGFLFNCMQMAFILSGYYTIISHALLLFNMSIVFIIIFRLVQRQPISKWEIMGTFVAIGGIGIISLDKSSNKVDKSSQNLILGDIIAIIGALFYAVFLNTNKVLINKIPPQLALFYLQVIGAMLVTIYGLILGMFTFDFHPLTGVFGYLNKDFSEMTYGFLVVGLFTSTIQFAAFAIANKYYSTLLIGSVYLLEILISQILGCLLRIDQIPGIVTFLGGSVITIGLFLIIYGENVLKKRREMENIRMNQCQEISLPLQIIQTSKENLLSAQQCKEQNRDNQSNEQR